MVSQGTSLGPAWAVGSSLGQQFRPSLDRCCIDVAGCMAFLHHKTQDKKAGPRPPKTHIIIDETLQFFTCIFSSGEL